MKLTESVAEISFLVSKALDGLLTLEELYAVWQVKWDDDYLKAVYDTLESSVEHMPGEFFSGEVDIDSWKSQENFKILLTDSILLESYHELSTLQLLLKRRTKKYV